MVQLGSSPTWQAAPSTVWSDNFGGIISDQLSGNTVYTGTISNIVLSPLEPMSRIQGLTTPITGVSMLRYGFISPALDLFSSAFVRYRVVGLKFCYEPQSPTTKAQRCVFAYANDPIHPLILEPQTTTSTEKLLALEDSIAFAPWLPWTLDCSRSCNTDLLYCSQSAVASTGATADPTNITDLRFTSFGSVACAVDNRNMDEPEVFGVVYIEMGIELFELNPVSTDRPESKLGGGTNPDEASTSELKLGLPDAAVLLKHSMPELKRR